MPETGLTHFDAGGAAIMVDVSDKNKTHREAIASGRICVSEAVYAAITKGTAKIASYKTILNYEFLLLSIPQKINYLYEFY